MKKYFLGFVVIIACYFPLRNSLHRLLTVNGGRFSTDVYKLDLINRPIQQAVSFINTQVSPDKKILALRQGDVSYYTDHEFVGQFDPRLTKVLDSKNVESLYKYLKEELALDYIYVPEYGEPVVYNSKLQHLISNPDYVELLADFSGYRVYKLELDRSRLGEEVSRSSFFQNGLTVQNEDEDFRILTNVKKFQFDGSLANQRTRLISGLGTLDVVGSKVEASPSDYLLGKIELSGRGKVTVKILEYFSDGTTKYRHLWDGAVTQPRAVNVMTELSNKSQGYRILVDFKSTTSLVLESFEVARYSNLVKKQVKLNRFRVTSSKRADPQLFSKFRDGNLELFGTRKDTVQLVSNTLLERPKNHSIKLDGILSGCGVVNVQIINGSKTQKYILDTFLLVEGDRPYKLALSKPVEKNPRPVDLIPYIRYFIRSGVNSIKDLLLKEDSLMYEFELELSPVLSKSKLCPQPRLRVLELAGQYCNAEGKCQSI